MKKFIILTMFFINLNLAFSYTIDDYLLFEEAKKEMESENYENSILKFRSLKDSFKNSPIVESNYYNFYYAMALYKKGDLEKAFDIMERAVYIPEGYNGKNFFENERTFFLAKIILETQGVEAATPYLTKLISDSMNPKDEKYENFSFNILKDRGNKYLYLYNLKHKGDFNHLNDFSKDELLLLAKYFHAKRDYLGQEKIFSSLLSKSPKNQFYISQYLSALSLQKKNRELLNVTDQLQKELDFPEIFYFRGLGFISEGDFNLAIHNLEKSEYLNFKYNKSYGSRPARELIAIIYSTLEDHQNLISLLEDESRLSKTEETLLVDAYLRIGNLHKGTSLAKDFIRKYPFSLNSNKLYYILTGIDYKNKDVLNSFFYEKATRNLIDINRHLVSKMPTFKINLKAVHNNPEVQRIFKVAKLKDEQLLGLAMSRNRLLANDSISSAYLITQLYELGGFYESAFANSFKNRDSFFKYRNLTKLLYPKYFKKSVESSAQEFGLPENMIYTLIRYSSSFNPNFVDEQGVGLMRLPSELDEKYIHGSTKLFDPDTNIKIGAKKLKELIQKNRGVKTAALIEFCFGEEVLKSLKFNKGDFTLETIRDPLLKDSINSLISTYIFYEIFYPSKADV